MAKNVSDDRARSAWFLTPVMSMLMVDCGSPVTVDERPAPAAAAGGGAAGGGGNGAATAAGGGGAADRAGGTTSAGDGFALL
jgi:hypothetical protein